jgi:hypothetical protein
MDHKARGRSARSPSYGEAIVNVNPQDSRKVFAAGLACSKDFATAARTTANLA